MNKTILEPCDKLPVREVTESVYNSLILDVWPSPAGIVDFGIKTDEHYAALQFAVRSDGVTAEQLDDACGCGSALTALITAGNPYRGVEFATVWDSLMVPIKSWAVVTPKTFSLGRLFASPTLLTIATRADVNAALEKHAASGPGEEDSEYDKIGRREVDQILSRHLHAEGGFYYVRTTFNPPMTIVLDDSEMEFEGGLNE